MTTKSWPYVGLVGFSTFPRWKESPPELDYKVVPATDGSARWVKRFDLESEQQYEVYVVGEAGKMWRYGVWRPKR